MRSYFNKPSWASRGDGDEGTDFYRRAGKTYNDIIATDMHARQRRTIAPESSSRKRRRPSNQSIEGDAPESDAHPMTSTEANFQLENLPVPEDVSQECDSDAETSTKRSSLPTTKEPNIEANSNMVPTLQSSQKGIVPDPRAPPAEITFASSPDKISNEATDNNMKGRMEALETSTDAEARRTDQNTAYDNTVVQILITSEIADTKPLIIHRKMSQPLKGVRLAWCERQRLPKEVTSTVFLTWKGKRLFDVTTCRSLNFESHGAFTKELSWFHDCFSDTDGHRLHMEAVTEEMFAAGYSSPRKTPGLSLSPTGRLTAFQRVKPHALHEITLRCPGCDDLKIRVSLATRVAQLISVFCESRGSFSDMKVYLAFDGDRLDPESSLADYEIDDGDLIEVMSRKEI